MSKNDNKAPAPKSDRLDFVRLDEAARRTDAPSVSEFVSMLDRLTPAQRRDLADELLEG